MPKKLNYQVGFTVDTNSLSTALNQAMQSLQKIGSNPNLQLSQQLKDASNAALDLANHLRTAFNQETGKLDLISFNNSLKQSNLSLEQYAQQLISIGPDGEKAFLNVAQAISRAELPLKRSNKLLNELWITMKNTARWQLTSSALHSFMGAVSTAYGYTKNLNESLNSIQIVTEKNNESMSKFAENANKAAKALSTTTVDYTDASLIYYQQGLSDAEVEKRTNTTIKLANVAGESAQMASEQLTAIWNNFYDGSKSLEYYADVMTALGAATASSTQEISAGVQKFAAVAETVGLSYEYATTALATITAKTRESADVVGTSLRTLFARIQGLLQDEEQDDGTTLNKYSKALAQVGIDIKDTSGELKGMNDILDEMAMKWSTLTNAQQMALAQTVAGVRQYTQLIALMENWDFFQENLSVAMGAEGTLEKQAQIYASSWEAARDRVRAATEDIYDSIVNEDFFIGLDNAFTPILSGVADVVDALGGMRGILSAVALIMNRVYGDKIAQSMRDFVTNIKIISGVESQRARDLQAQANKLVENLSITMSANQANQLRLSTLKEEIILQGTINEKIDKLDASQRQWLDTEQYKLSLLKQESNQIIETISKLESSVMNKEEQLFFDVGLKEGWQQRLSTSLAKFNQTRNRANQIQISVNAQSNIDEIFGQINNQLQQFSTNKAIIDNVRDAISKLGNQTDLTEDQVREFNEQLNRVGLQIPQGITSISDILKSLSEQSSISSDKIRGLAEALRSIGGNETQVRQYVAELLQLAAASEKGENTSELLRQKLQEISKVLQNDAVPATRDWATVLVQIGSSISKVSLGLTGLKNLIDIFDNEDLDGIEKFVQSLISLSMVLPFMVTIIKGLQSITVLGNLGTIFSGAAAGATGLAGGIAGITAAAGAVLPVIVAIVGAIGALTIVASKFILTEKKARENIEKTNTAFKEQTEAVEQLENNLKTANDRLEELLNQDSLTVVEEEELSKLRQEIALLERQLEIEKELQKITAIANKEAVKDNLEKATEVIKDIPTFNYNDIYSKNRIFNNRGEYDQSSPIKWYEKAEQEFKKAYESLPIDETYEKGLKSLQEYRDNWIKADEQFKQTQRDYIIENQEIFDQIEDWYSQFLSEVELGGVYSEQEAKETKERFQDILKSYREFVAGIRYNEIYITPAIDNTALSKVKDKIYQLTNYQGLEDDTILDQLGLSSEEIKKVIQFLDKLGIKLQDVINEIQQDLENSKQGLSRILGLEEAGQFINKQSAADLSLIASLNWDENAEFPIDSLNDMYYVMTKIVTKTKDWTTSLEDARQAAHEALDILSQGERLDSETTEKLQNLFQGIYDLSNLDMISTYEQAVQIGEAFKGLTDIDSNIQNLNTTLIENKERLAEVRYYLNDAGDAANYLKDSSDGLKQNNILKPLDSIGTNAEKVATKVEKIETTWEDVQSALEEEAVLKVSIEEAEKQIEQLSKFKLNPIEVEIANIESIIAQMAQIDKAASLIGEDFKVQAENVKELAETLPELFYNNLGVMEDGIVQLNKETVEAVSQAARESAIAQAESLGEALQARIDATTQELGLIYAIRNAAINGSNEAVQAVISDSGKERQNKEMVAKQIVKAKLQQSIQEKTASAQTAADTIGYGNQVVDASKTQGESFVKNWEKVLRSISDMAQTAFENVANAQPGGSGKFDNVIETASGLLVGGNVNFVFQSTDIGDPYGDVASYLENDGNLLSLEERQEINRAYWEDIENERANEVANQISELTGIEVTAENVKGGFLDLYGVFESADNFIELLDSAASQMEKDIALGTAELSALNAAQNAANNLLNADVPNSSDEKETPEKEKQLGQIYDNKDDLKNLEEIEDRYHEINREIKYQDSLLEDINNNMERAYGVGKFKIFKAELKELNKQMLNQQYKMNEAEAYLKKDAEKLNTLFANVEYNEHGEISNYEKGLLRDQALADYNAFYNGAYKTEYLDKLNELADDKEVQDAFKQQYEQYWEEQKKVVDKLFDDRLDATKQYEDTLDVYQEVKDAYEDLARQVEDNILSQIEYRFELVLDVKSMRDGIREFQKATQEIFGDALTHNIGKRYPDLNTAGTAREQAEAEAAMLPQYQKQYNDLLERYNSTSDFQDKQRILKDIQELQEKVLDSANALVEWVNSIEELVPKAVEAAAERFALFTDQLEHNTTVVDTIKELYVLQGVTYKTMEGFNRLQASSQERLDAQLAQASIQRKWFDEAKKNLEIAQANLDSLNGDESDIRYDTYKKARDAYLTEFNEAQEAYLSLARDAMQTAQDMYLEQIEKAVYEFGQAVSGGIGLDLLQDKYDHYIEKDERYFDKVNEAYETTAWYNKLQTDIDKTTNAATKARLKALQEEIDARRQNNKLSQYDLDILNAKYDVLKAQIALEDAQNAKNNLQLVRDRQGNWNYQFTADPNSIKDAEKDLLDAQNEWYNIAKQQVTDITGEIISTWQECQDKIKEIYSDLTLTDEERANRAEEIYNYYTDKIKYLEEEKQVAIADMTEAGNASLFTSSVIMGDKLTDLTGVTADEIKAIVEQSGHDITDLLTADNETMKNIIASNSDLINLFDNVYGKDLDNMTNNTIKFEDILQNTMSEAEEDFRNYGDTVKNVADETGTSLEDLDYDIQNVSNSTDQLRDSGYDAAAALWDMVSATYAEADSQLVLAQNIWETVRALEALAMAQTDFVEQEAGLGGDNSFGSHYYVSDYSKELLRLFDTEGIGSKILDTNGEFGWLWEERNEKWQNEGWKDKGVRSNADLWEVFASAASGEKWALDLLDEIRRGTAFFDTGGYTGLFNDAKLAFLHQKELVLNEDDTKNILDAVNSIRDIDSNVFTSIGKALEDNTIAAMQLMTQKLMGVSMQPISSNLEQTIHIDEVKFEGATTADEIKEAFRTIANDAAQWANRRKE